MKRKTGTSYGRGQAGLENSGGYTPGISLPSEYHSGRRRKVFIGGRSCSAGIFLYKTGKVGAG